MEITTRSLWAMVHGMGFGALYLLACSGALVGLSDLTRPASQTDSPPRYAFFLKVYLAAMVVLAWATVLTGAYILYPWYRAAAPAGQVDLSMYPQRLLMATPATIGWHSLGMEWKEHVAWFAPISITMVAFVFTRYGAALKHHRQLRAAVLCFTSAAFLAAAIAAFFGAMINKSAPLKGGPQIRWMRGVDHQ
jgi:hypothetical protein